MSYEQRAWQALNEEQRAASWGQTTERIRRASLPAEPLLAPGRLASLQAEPLLAPGIAPRFSTRRGRMSTLCAVFVGCCIAGGPLNAWVTLEPILAAQGVFNSSATFIDPRLNAVQTYAWGAGMLLSVPLGIFYDSMGPAVTSFAGAVLAALAMLAMGLSISRPEWNWLLPGSYALAQIGGSLNSYALIGWVWLLPSRQGLVTSLYMASQAISDSLALVGVALHNTYGLPLEYFFFVCAAASLCMGLLTFWLAPSYTENALHYSIASQDQGAAEHEYVNTPSTGGAWARCSAVSGGAVRGLKDCVQVVKLHPVACILMQLFTITIYISVFYPMSEMFSFYQKTLGPAVGTELVDAFAVIYGTSGALWAIAGGLICDRIGIVRTQKYCTVLILITSVIEIIPSFACQIIWQLLWTAFFGMFSVFFMRFAQHYAPFELFGTFQGLFCCCITAIAGDPLTHHRAFGSKACRRLSPCSLKCSSLAACSAPWQAGVRTASKCSTQL
jgi:nitrate/nitrite transporter NarK